MEEVVGGGDLADAHQHALGRLAAQAPQPAELVRLRFYGGASIAEAAAALGISPATAKRHWVFARALLFKELSAAG